jgi:signal transduction histidine kinase
MRALTQLCRIGRWAASRLRRSSVERAGKSITCGVGSAVFAEQVETLFWQMPVALIVNLVNAALVAAVLTPLAARAAAPSVWFAAIAVVTVARAILWQRYRRVAGAQGPRQWSNWATIGALAAGLAWGLGGALLFPFLPRLGQLLLTVVVGGMCTGAVVLGASHLPALMAFLVAACVPMAVRFLSMGTPVDDALGVMIGVFCLAMALSARHLNRTFVEAMRLRFELREANQRLLAEIGRHRATESALLQAQKLEALGQLSGGIAHDFNNLLTIMIGNLVLASQRLGAGSAVMPLIEEAVQAAERAAALSQRLLGFVRKQRHDPQPVDLRRLLSEITDMLRRTLGPQVRLIVEIAPDVAPVEVDPIQLELAILNLAINARDAMPDGGTLRIAVWNRERDASASDGRGRYSVVEIVDNGTGMDEATLARAFDPFFTTKEPGVGTGLGLPMVQAFAARSGGWVWLSSAPGQGTRAELWLPLAERSPATISSAPAPEPMVPQGGARILLCEDDDGVRRFVSDYLDSIGCTVREADRAETALRLIEEDAAIDLLIVDYAMPGMNGLDTVRQARQRRPGLKALMITGDAGAMPDGTAEVEVLPKPFSPAELGRKVAEAAAQPTARVS